jgi:hypothetical protein
VRHSIESDRARTDKVGKEILIPLTSSLYVPGKLTDVENVVIDVGTGYYVKKVRFIPWFLNESQADGVEQGGGNETL